jgi:hypothetical protein
MPLHKVKTVEQANKATSSFEISSVDLGVLHYAVWLLVLAPSFGMSNMSDWHVL